MKTEQISRYVSKCHFSDDDWTKVLQWCKKHFGGGKAHRAIKPISESTYEQFIEWADHGIGTGDVVKYKDGIGIIGDCTPDKSFLTAYIMPDGQFIQSKLEIASDGLILASQQERKHFHDILKEHGVMFSCSVGDCVPAWLPDHGDFVRVIYQKKNYLGIFDTFTDEGCLFYCLNDRKEIRISYEIPSYDITFCKASATDKERIERSLQTNGYQWDIAYQTLQSVVDKRRVRGDVYWYMSEMLSPSSDYDRHRKLDDERYNAKNYFYSIKECWDFCQRVRDLQKQ